VSILRTTLSKAILVMSGQARMMYQCLKPKPEGAIFSKRSKPQGTRSSPHDSAANMTKRLEMNIQGDTETRTFFVDTKSTKKPRKRSAFRVRFFRALGSFGKCCYRST
jgi:hypothetical protein